MPSGKKPSRLRRVARLGGLTSRVGSTYLGQKVKGVFQDEELRKRALDKLHVENAETIARTMGSLKGAAMKVGQQLAQVAEGMDLPPEVAASLKTLNDKAEPVPFETVRAEIERELEASVGVLFERIDPAPLGTASLAQAHAAWLEDGTPVVVKVLHPGVEASVDTDLAALKSIFITGRVMGRDREEIENIFAEIHDRLLEELDYYQEAANISAFGEAFVDADGVHIPDTYPKFCTERVLTMDRLMGVPLDEFVKTASPEARQRAGETLVDCLFRMVYDLRMLHADPHAGNFLFEPDGTVGFIDFGCVKRFDEFFVANYSRVALAAFARDRDGAIAVLRQMGVIEGHDREAEDLLWDLVDAIAGPFREGVFTAGSHKDSLQDRIQRLVPRFLRYPQIRTPRDMIYLHRTMAGFYAMLRKLETRADWGAVARPYHELAIARAEGRA
jgi:predicted unusual protein kinase regulating ubiquinone biosynthesis (AarF/ABC1/UbiB family)